MPQWAKYGAGVVAVLAIVVGAVFALQSDDEPEVTPTPGATPVSARHHLITLVDSSATFGEAQVNVSGVVRGRTAADPDIEAVSLAIEPFDVEQGSTGPISVALGDGPARVSMTGADLSATFPVRFYYPLLNDVAGEQVSGDVVQASQEHRGQMTLDARIENRTWQGTLEVAPGTLIDVELRLPEGTITLDTPAVYETDAQFRANGGGVPVACVELAPEGEVFSPDEQAAALAELRAIWDDHDYAIFTRPEIEQLNATITQQQPGADEIRHPERIPLTKCYTIALAASNAQGDGITVDVARRTITVGQNALEACEGTTLGRLLAHGFGHAALGVVDHDEALGEDNLMRPCAPGSVLTDDQTQDLWSFMAEVAPAVTIPGAGARENIVFDAIASLLEDVAQEPLLSPTPDGSPSPTPGPTARRTPRPTRRPTPAATAAPTAAPTPAPTPSPTAVPTASPTAEPTATPTAEPTPTATLE